MTNSKIRPSSPVLDQDTLNLLGDSLVSETLPAPRKKAVFTNILSQVAQQDPDLEPRIVTVRANEGEWFNITPKVEKKILYFDKKRKIESYLLRAQPGAELPSHVHEQDEYCMVLEGDVMFDDIELHAGDFHLARQGSWHSTARSRGGALVYLESAIMS